MPREEQIKATYKRVHDELSEVYYGQEPEGQLGKDEFDTLHGQIWDTMRDELTELKVEGLH